MRMQDNNNSLKFNNKFKINKIKLRIINKIIMFILKNLDQTMKVL